MKFPGKSYNPTDHFAIQEEPLRHAVSHIQRKFLDIAYANRSPSHKLDINLSSTDDCSSPGIHTIYGVPS